LFLLALILCPGVSSAQQEETPRDTEAAVARASAEQPTPADQPSAEEPAAASAESDVAAPAVEGPLYVVTPEGDSAEEVREIYREGDLAFLHFFWWWIVLIAGLAGAGALAYWIWGKRRPKRMSRL